jgi:hypothetical protein
MKQSKTFLDRMAKRRTRKKAIADRFESMTPDEKLACIPHPGCAPTEFEIQSYLFWQMRSLGLCVRGEMRSKCDRCIFDRVISAGERPVRIIEVKKHKPMGTTRRDRRARGRAVRAQVERYSEFGIPVDLVTSMREAKDYVAKLHYEN